MSAFVPISAGGLSSSNGMNNSQSENDTPGKRIGDTAEYLQHITDKVIDPIWGTTTQRPDGEGGGSGEYHDAPPPKTSMDVAFKKWQNQDTSIDPYWAWQFDRMNRYHEGRFAPGYAGEEGKYKPVSLQLAKDTLAQWEHDSEGNWFDNLVEKAVPVALTAIAGQALTPILGAGGAGAVAGASGAVMSGGDPLKGAFIGWAGGTLASSISGNSAVQDALGKTGAKIAGGAASGFATSGGNPLGAVKGAVGSTINNELGNGVVGTVAKTLVNDAISRAGGSSSGGSSRSGGTTTTASNSTKEKHTVGFVDPSLFSRWVG